jgi:hypothetical protein
MLPTKNVEKIELFGKEYILSERTARDVNKLIAYSKQKKQKSVTDVLIEATITLEDGLKINWINLKWWQFIKKWILKRRFSKTNLLVHLSPSQIFSYAAKVYSLEGISPDDVKKKRNLESMISESAEMLPLG